jgi:hypothetical protein
MSRNRNHEQGVKKKSEIQKEANHGATQNCARNGRGRTPIERIFCEVVGREMDSEEQETLLNPMARSAKSAA